MAEAIPTPSHRRFQDLTGQTFGRLTVVSYAGRKLDGRHAWNCSCSCGGKTISSTSDLRTGNSKSCGCLQRERVAECGKANRIHGLSKHHDFHVWVNMVARCHNSQHPRYGDYGGRGITVCERWRESPASFFADMGPRPPGYTIERRNNGRGYSPDNCQWIPRPLQARNTRANHFLTHAGRTMTIAEWAEEIGISARALWCRISYGWTVEEALTLPAGTNKIKSIRENRLLTHNGETLSIAQWADRVGINKSALYRRIQNGWSVSEALTRPPDLANRWLRLKS